MGDAPRSSRLVKSNRGTPNKVCTLQTRQCCHIVPSNNPETKYARELAHFLLYKSSRFPIYEWFYSYVDREFFARNEFKEELKQLGLSEVRSHRGIYRGQGLHCLLQGKKIALLGIYHI